MSFAVREEWTVLEYTQTSRLCLVHYVCCNFDWHELGMGYDRSQSNIYNLTLFHPVRAHQVIRGRFRVVSATQQICWLRF